MKGRCFYPSQDNNMTSKKVLLITALFAVLLIGAACGLTGCFGEGGQSNPPAGGDVVKGLPPDPGETGKATLAGIDSDSDGVRDDVQRYIALTYPGSEKNRAALTQYAKSEQAALLDAGNREASIAHSREAQRAIECLFFVRPDDADSIHSDLQTKILNTKERSEAYIKANGQLGGQVFFLSDDPKSGCNFDPNTMGD